MAKQFIAFHISLLCSTRRVDYLWLDKVSRNRRLMKNQCWTGTLQPNESSQTMRCNFPGLLVALNFPMPPDYSKKVKMVELAISTSLSQSSLITAIEEGRQKAAFDVTQKLYWSHERVIDMIDVRCIKRELYFPKQRLAYLESGIRGRIAQLHSEERPRMCGLKIAKFHFRWTTAVDNASR